ncbi:hypothetical protein POM88_012361 [Heracleum sosnowskyi]|uniref:PGG domain-containing protein n=1 Tax=Heracleum sosnowskyi TaxID=360622 RepID=A0AAD8IWN0_9APIA|nr:hypothetical protein POM88_012361 [Heracleum sosnowskyi]
MDNRDLSNGSVRGAEGTHCPGAFLRQALQHFGLSCHLKLIKCALVLNSFTRSKNPWMDISSYDVAEEIYATLTLRQWEKVRVLCNQHPEAIYNEHFELALHIARTIPELICEEDHKGMTGLHMLAMNSSAFEIRYGKWLKFLLRFPFRHLFLRPSAYEISGEDSTGHKVDDGAAGSHYVMTFPYWNKIRKEHRRYQAARKLGSILVKKDTKWIEKLESSAVAVPVAAVAVAAVAVADPDAYAEDDNSVENLKNTDKESVKADANSTEETSGSVYGENQKKTDRKKVKPPTPLILATKYGCLDIALEIIKEHPQTVDQVGREYGSILHLAIKYRRIEIFDEVEKMQMQMRRLVRLPDKDKNSILHMVALNTTKVKVKNGSDATSTDMPKDKPLHPWDTEELTNDSRSPAFVLQDDLLLFERVEDILKTHYHKVPNKDHETEDQLFAAKKEPLRDDAQEWMKRTAENCSIVAVLIATVAFAAAYTVPGGSNPDGSPVLLNQAFFVVFTITDVLSLASTLTAVVVFLSILCSSYRLQDFKETLPKSLMFGISCLIFSLTMMMFAFAATIILMIKNRQQWTRIALYAVAFLPVTVLVATYLPFYVPLMRTFNYTVDKAKSIMPTFTRIHKPSLSKIKKLTTVVKHSSQV